MSISLRSVSRTAVRFAVNQGLKAKHAAAAAAAPRSTASIYSFDAASFTPEVVTAAEPTSTTSTGDGAQTTTAEFEPGFETVSLPASWIDRNAAPLVSGQRPFPLEVSAAAPQEVQSIRVSDDATEVHFTMADGSPRSISADHLIKFALRPKLTSTTPLTSEKQMERLEYMRIVENKKPLLQALSRDGVVVVRGCPTDDKSVITLAKLLAPTSAPAGTLYGFDWKVDRAPDSDGPRNNIAYTGVFLDLHNDLIYYESMPGVQLLHCQRFDNEVTGGDSFFVDAFGAAEELRAEDPEAFKTLCTVPGAFMKHDPNREAPAHYYYGSPHITLATTPTQPAETAPVRKVLWAPAFEAPQPLHLGDAALAAYDDAYRKFAKVLLKWRNEKVVRFRLTPGDCVLFAQGRVLHGRDSFTEPRPGMRRLHGCYVNIDDYCSTVQGKCDPQGVAPPMASSNGSWL